MWFWWKSNVLKEGIQHNSSAFVRSSEDGAWQSEKRVDILFMMFAYGSMWLMGTHILENEGFWKCMSSQHFSPYNKYQGLGVTVKRTVYLQRQTWDWNPGKFGIVGQLLSIPHLKSQDSGWQIVRQGKKKQRKFNWLFVPYRDA